MPFSSVRLPLLAGLMLVPLLAVACGGDGEPGDGTPAQGDPTPTIFLDNVNVPLTPAASPQLTIDLASTPPLLTVLAADPRDLQTGISSVAAGDFNGDGIQDLLIGMPFADAAGRTREDAGEAYVIFGGSELPGGVDLAADPVGLRILGALPGDNLGFTVAAGDLNGDGVDDVIVTATGSNGLDNVRTDLGETYVILGRPGLAGTIDTLHGEQDFTLIAAEGFARVGTSLVVADVNGDGFDDLVAGAPFAGREPGTQPGGPRTTVGEVYAVFGSRDFGGRVSVAEDQQDFTMSGLARLDGFGHSVAAADVNADGIADIIVGARGYDGPSETRIDAGAVYVFFGARQLSGKRAADEADVTLLGAASRDSLGEVVAAGDFNGDGVWDVAAAAPAAGGPEAERTNSGQVHILYGSPALASRLDLATDSTDAVVYGPNIASLLAGAAAVADVDGDGRDDLVLGVPLDTSLERLFSGAVYVVSGKRLQGRLDLRRDVEDAIFVYAARQRDGLGTGIAIGDVNGNGRPELILAAAGPAGQPGQEAGPARVFVVTLP